MIGIPSTGLHFFKRLGRLPLEAIRSWSTRYESGFANLREIRTDPRTGRATSKARRITSWTGVQIGGLSVTADGKYFALQKGPTESDVYVGELEANGTRLMNPRRLTLDDRDDEPSAWTLDRKAVLFDSNRNGSYDNFRQALDQRTAEAVVTSREDKFQARVSPDGAWVMYFAFSGWLLLGEGAEVDACAYFGWSV